MSPFLDLAALAFLLVVVPPGSARGADEPDPATLLPKVGAEKRDATRET
jgi:hypothetical protein